MTASPWLLPATLAAVFACAGLGVSPVQAQIFSCAPDTRDVAIKVLKETSSSFDADLAAATAAIAAAAKFKEAALAGHDVPAPYIGAAQFAKQAANATSPEVAELLRRAANDALARSTPGIAMTRTYWAAGLSEPAFGYTFRIVSLDICGVDQDNTAWLKERLKAHGWFSIPDYGKEADSAAFLIVQHADKDRPFQAEVLKQLEMLALEGRTRPKNYAMLYDRVAIGEGRPQRYGSQGTCAGPGVWTPFKTEDPANLDKRRVAMGLQPQADYVASISARACGKPN